MAQANRPSHRTQFAELKGFKETMVDSLLVPDKSISVRWTSVALAGRHEPHLYSPLSMRISLIPAGQGPTWAIPLLRPEIVRGAVPRSLPPRPTP